MTGKKELPSISGYGTVDWPANIPSNLLRTAVTNEFTVDPVSGLPSPKFNPSEEFIDWVKNLDRESQILIIDEACILLSVSVGVPRDLAREIIRRPKDPIESLDLLAYSVDLMLQGIIV